MSRILGFLRDLHLSLAEWFAVAAAFLVGSLVAALKVQGRRLHKAQLDLLDVRLVARSRQTRKDSEVALAAYDRTKESYLRHGGKL